MFSHRNFHKYIWTTPDGKTHDKFDRIMIDRRKPSSIINVRSVTGADCFADRYLVVAKVREKLAASQQAANATFSLRR